MLDEFLEAPADPAAERRLLEVYADLRAVSRSHGADTPSPQQYLHAFLRSLDAAAEGLPERFVAGARTRAAPLRGRRPGAHRRVGSRLLSPVSVAPTLRHRAQRGPRDPRAPPRTGGRPPGRENGELREVLDRLEAALAAPEPGLAELAREVRWRCCDQPLIEEGRQDIYGDADAHIAALAVRPDDDGEEHVQALVDCPQPLAPRVFRRIDDASPRLREQLLEVDDPPLLPDRPARGRGAP